MLSYASVFLLLSMWIACGISQTDGDHGKQKVKFSVSNEDDLRAQLEQHFRLLLDQNPQLLLDDVIIETTLFDSTNDVISGLPSTHTIIPSTLTNAQASEKVTTESTRLTTFGQRETTASDSKFITQSFESSTKDTSVDSIETTNPITSLPACGFKYNGKCFLVVRPKSGNVDFNEGKHLCTEKGTSLANIYNVEYYDLTADYIRKEVIGDGTFGNIFLWTGMVYEKDNGIKLSTGDWNQNLLTKWYLGHPYYGTSKTKIVLSVDRLLTAFQGILNYSPETSSGLSGSLCEYIYPN